MEHILTLVGNPARPALNDQRVAAARAMMRRAGLRCAATDWLAPGIACDIAFAGAAPETVMTLLRPELDSAGLDLFAQPLAGRRKHLLVADMDSTIIAVECIDELADFAGKKAHVAAITERAMRGELDFPAALRERALILRDMDESVLARCYAERVRLNPGAAALVATMRANGAYAALVSGGFTFFTERVAAAVGFDYHQANRLLVAGGRLTGTVGEPILDASAKLRALTRLSAERHLDLSDALAVGDGANDLPMVQTAGLGVAYHAKPLVAQAARARVDHGDLTALLYYQGYHQAEFAR